MFSKIYSFGSRVNTAMLTRWWGLTGRWYLNLHGVITEGPLTLYGYPLLTVIPESKIVLSERVVLCSDARFTALGVSHPVILRTIRPNARIIIGPNTGLSGVTICAAVSIEIGSECLLGADVQIFDNDFHKIKAENRRFDNCPENIKSAPVIIENNVFIGAGSKIMKGVRIGCNSVIGAGSVVTKDIPQDSIAAGNPAKIISKIPT
jgi:carbonic anhydrase/acetyltransferase-like protein (isoleucine patch superfamily)